MEFISPEDLWQIITTGSEEYSILDVREEGSFANNHLLLASNAPLSKLELIIERLVPRKTTPIILCDATGSDHNGAPKAFETLNKQKYENLKILRGGISKWKEAGFSLYSGIHVVSKAFGEYIEEKYETPHISPADLSQILEDTKKNVVVLDSRPKDEFFRMSLPNAINIPGAELVHRIQEVAPDPKTLVVINCAGRTRSIIGAQSLINAGLQNDVVALENGTMGWHLAGLPLATRQETLLPKTHATGRSWSVKSSIEVARRTQLELISWQTLQKLKDQSEQHTLYFLDVRTPEEFCAGHLPGARSAPGGQLVQTTDKFIGTHRARVVLTCDNGTRSRMTASWLAQMGRRNVLVLDTDYQEFSLVHDEGPEKERLPHFAQSISARALSEMPSGTPKTILDFANSREYKNGHIPGSWFIIRSDLDRYLAEFSQSSLLILTSPDGKLATLACQDLVNKTTAKIMLLEGGTESWIQAGYHLSSDSERMISQGNDVYQLPYDYGPDEKERQMKAYLDWETGLLEKIKKDPSINFIELID
mgnify:CR=1 FL=1